MRTFSKIYGIAGVRIGYGITSPEVASYLDLKVAQGRATRTARWQAWRDRQNL